MCCHHNRRRGGHYTPLIVQGVVALRTEINARKTAKASAAISSSQPQVTGLIESQPRSAQNPPPYSSGPFSPDSFNEKDGIDKDNMGAEAPMLMEELYSSRRELVSPQSQSWNGGKDDFGREIGEWKIGDVRLEGKDAEKMRRQQEKYNQKLEKMAEGLMKRG